MKNPLKKTALTVLLTIISIGGATPAQKTIKSDLLLEYDGVETFAGTSDPINSILWGITLFMQNVSYSKTNCLTISINNSTERFLRMTAKYKTEMKF